MKNYKLWSVEEENKLRELVATKQYSYRQIGVIMGRNVNSVTSHARQYLKINNQYQHRKYRYIKNFFREPNIINSYIAGFLAADASIMNMKSGSVRIRLEIHKNDEKHLKWVADTMGHDGPICYWGNKKTRYWQMFVDSDYAKDMEKKFGLVPNKTHRLVPPVLGRFDLDFAYFLGLIDGDGCIHLNNIQQLSLSYVSSSLAAAKWVKFLIERLEMQVIRKTKSSIITDLRPVANAYRFTRNGLSIACLIVMAQEFSRQYGLEVLHRKWNDERVNTYIKEFFQKYKITFDAQQKIKALENSSNFSVYKHTNYI